MTDKEKRKEQILMKAHELAKSAKPLVDNMPLSTIIAATIEMAEWCDSNPLKKPVEKMWHDASETPSIFSTYLLVHDGGWCVARYFGKEVPTGNTTGWVEISENIFIEHPQQWLDLSDLLPPKKKEE